MYLEDGSDVYVSNVAALYVTNISEYYLEYATVKCEFNGQEATFVVTGLKPGASAWVLEKDRMVVPGTSSNDITANHISDDHIMRYDSQDLTAGVDVDFQSGYLTATNNTPWDLRSVYIYYKQQFLIENEYQNGIYLGGITYRVYLGDISKGESVQSIAAHCTPQGCEVVRIDWA